MVRRLGLRLIECIKYAYISVYSGQHEVKEWQVLESIVQVYMYSLLYDVYCQWQTLRKSIYICTIDTNYS